jgi:hypothetical protein
MNNVAVKTVKDKIVVTFDKTDRNLDLVLSFLNRFDVEESSRKINFSKNILQIAEDMKSSWWKANKKRFLKNKA